MSEEKKVIAVFGATGAQGGSVVKALKEQGIFTVRALTRNPDKHPDLAHEVVKADLNDPASVSEALKGVYGVFLLTNFWEGGGGNDEKTQALTAVKAAKEAGVEFLLWSTLPNVDKISDGKFDVPHFTLKAHVDEVIKTTEFKHYAFVEAPLYFQNFLSIMAPVKNDDGTATFHVPIPTDSKTMHAGDISQIGYTVAGVFAAPEKVENGSYIAFASGAYSFDDFVAGANAAGYKWNAVQVDADKYTSIAGKELCQMLLYFADHTYMGPEGQAAIDLGASFATQPATSFQDWIAANPPAAE